jgi:lauroyl/myristoyl acyltransferase
MKELFEKVRTEYGVEIAGENDMSGAWKLVEMLKEKGWVVYIITARGREQVDAWHPNYGSLYAQFGEIPYFESVVEGICLTALHVRELEKNGTL